MNNNLKQSVRRFGIVCLLVASVATFATGCAHKQNITSRHLEQDQITASGGLTMPGTFYLPKVSGMVGYGFGGGDIIAHASTSGLTAGGGLTGRAYVSDRYHFEAAALYRRPSTAARLYDLPLLIPRLAFGSSTTPDRPWYTQFGLQGIFPNIGVDPLAQTFLIQTISIGYETDISEKVTFQFESTFPILGFAVPAPGHIAPVGHPLGEGSASVFSRRYGLQLSIGFHWFGAAGN